MAVADTVHNNDEARSCVSLVMITPDNNTPAAWAREVKKIGDKWC